MICSNCGTKTNNRRSKAYPYSGVYCDHCRAAIDEAERSQNEWEAQTGNTNFQYRHRRKREPRSSR